MDRAISGWPATDDLHLMVAQRLPCASVSYGFIVSSTVNKYWPLVLKRERLLDEAQLLAFVFVALEIALEGPCRVFVRMLGNVFTIHTAVASFVFGVQRGFAGVKRTCPLVS